ncbi:MAG: hypothetical protein II992_08320 [Lachnospiraceae bacterium]|nr:hypothetical protein [Lachnospiraceae bacterium]
MDQGLGDVLENKKKEKKPLRDAQKERIYQKVTQLIQSLNCVEQYELYVFIYKDIIRRLNRIDGYKDATALREEYEQRLKEYEAEAKENIYQNALALKENVKYAPDLQWVRKEIERIPDYKDVEEIAKWCDSKQNDMEKKERKLAVIRFIVLIFVIAFVAYGGTYLYSLIK